MRGDVDVSGKNNQLALNTFSKLGGNLDVSNGLLIPLSKDTQEDFVDIILAEADKHPGDIPLSFKVAGRVGSSVLVTTNKNIDMSTEFKQFLFNLL